MAEAGPTGPRGGSRVPVSVVGAENPVEIYLGFGLYLGGFGLSAAALAMFFWSVTLRGGAPAFWLSREVAFALAAIGLPTFLLGVVVLLPVGVRTAVAAAVGSLLCLGAVGAFVWAYPGRWNVVGATDYTAPAMAIYAVGLVAIAASTGVGLVSSLGGLAGGTGAAASVPGRRGAPDREPEAAPAGNHDESHRGAPDGADREALSTLDSDCLRQLFEGYDPEG